MKQADIELQIDRYGSTVPLKGVTPAEALYLVADHHVSAGKDPIISLVETGEAMTITGTEKKDGKEVPVLRPRSNGEEINRLRMKYPAKNLVKVFGSSYEPNLPSDFARARQAGVGVALPSGNLIDHKLSL